MIVCMLVCICRQEFTSKFIGAQLLAALLHLLTCFPKKDDYRQSHPMNVCLNAKTCYGVRANWVSTAKASLQKHRLASPQPGFLTVPELAV